MKTLDDFHCVKIGEAVLYLGDSAEILPLVTPVDSIVMDPPYEFRSEGAGKLRANRTYMDDIQNSGLSDGFDYSQFTNGRSGSVVVFCHNDQLLKLLHHFQHQFKRVAVCSWHKSNPMPVHNRHYLPDTEFYIHAWNDGCHPIGEHADKKRYFISSRGINNHGHPTEKPIDLMNKIIANVNGDTILDPYMGTGSTGVAAINDDRKFIGIEKDERWFDVAVRRCRDAVGQKQLEGAA